jgi:hypothetical protein
MRSKTIVSSATRTAAAVAIPERSEGRELEHGERVDYLEANPHIVRLLQWEMLSESTDERPFAPSSELFADLLEVLKTVLGKGARSGIDAAAFLGSLVSMCFLPSMLRGRVRALGTLSVEERKRHVIEVLLHGVT